MGIRSGDMEKTRAPLDFLGINLYYRTSPPRPVLCTARLTLLGWLIPVKMEGGQQGPKTDFGWEVWPKAPYDVVMRVTRDYNCPVIQITEEAGCSYNDMALTRGCHSRRPPVSLSPAIFAALARAISEGADVRGYHAWKPDG